MKIRINAPQKVYIPLGRLPLFIYISLGTKYKLKQQRKEQQNKKIHKTKDLSIQIYECYPPGKGKKQKHAISLFCFHTSDIYILQT